MMISSKRGWLSLAILFLFTTFILIIISMVGCISNYNPINNIYIFNADIRYLNITKVLPELSPLLTVLGTALTIPSNSVDDVLGAFQNLTGTPVLAPLLEVLIETNNASTTLTSLNELAPLAALGGDSSAVSVAVAPLEQLITLSNNSTQTFAGLEQLILASVSSNSTTDAEDQELVLQLLADSSNVTGSTEALLVLNNLTLAQKVSIAPLLSLIGTSQNISSTLGALSLVSNATLPTTLVDTLFGTLENVTNVSELNTTLTTLSALVPSNLKSTFTAVSALILNSPAPLTTVKTLDNLFSQNITSADWAKESLHSLGELVAYANNDTAAFSTISTLAANTNTATTTAELTALDNIFSSSNNDTATLKIISGLSTLISTQSPLTAYVPYVLGIINASTNPLNTINNLLAVVEWAGSNQEIFSPIVHILNETMTVPEVTQEQLNAMTPGLLGYLEVPTDYRLSLMAICHQLENGTIIDCQTHHPVQGLDFREIIYDALLVSEFEPYITALNITADELHLDGDLLNKQHEYVPAMKAVLSMSILSFISCLVGIAIAVWLIMKPITSIKGWFGIVAFVTFICVFTGLAAAITAAIVGIIKSGTKKDAYGVVITSGSAYYGLVWTSFCLTFLTVFIFFFDGLYSTGYIHTFRNKSVPDSESIDQKDQTEIEVNELSNSNDDSNSSDEAPAPKITV